MNLFKYLLSILANIVNLSHCLHLVPWFCYNFISFCVHVFVCVYVQKYSNKLSQFYAHTQPKKWSLIKFILFVFCSLHLYIKVGPPLTTTVTTTTTTPTLSIDISVGLSVSLALSLFLSLSLSAFSHQYDNVFVCFVYYI